MWVVKLGGSLWDTGDLARWLAMLAEPGQMTRLVVPGGGPFADRVRELQGQLGYDELAAHRMAILAMQQYGLALLSLCPAMRAVETPADARRLAAGRGVGVWLPWRMVGRDRRIAASWAITSDSLACVLARRLGAERLLLVKAAPVPEGPSSAWALADLGLIDAAFPGFAAGLACAIRIANKGAHFHEHAGVPVTIGESAHQSCISSRQGASAP